MRKNWPLLVAFLMVAMLLCPLMPVTVRAEAPLIDNVQALGISENGAVISWTTNINATGNVEYGTDPGGPYPSAAPLVADDTPDNILHGVVLFGLQPDTTYYYRVKSSDGIDPDETSAEYSFATNAFTISGVDASSITDSAATISWSTGSLASGDPVPATGNVEYGLDTSYGSTAPVPEDILEDSSSHIVVLSGLSANTTYHYRVKSEDALANEVVSVDFTFDTEPDATPPEVTNVAPVGTIATDTTAMITWDTDEPATSQVKYGTSSGGSYITTALDPTLVTIGHSVVLTELTAGTQYFYRVISKDASENETESTEYNFTTAADITPPVITNVAPDGVTIATDTTAMITWDTDEPATSQVKYGTSSGGPYTTTTLAPTLVTIGHSVLLTGLTPGTQYFYVVISKDASENETESTEYNFTTAADITPPVISGVSFDVGPATATIRWNTNESATSQVAYSTDSYPGDFANDIAATMDAYGLYSSEETTPKTHHVVILQPLEPNTTYYYRVMSVDSDGNEAVVVVQYSFTTAGDTTPPAVPALSSPADLSIVADPTPFFNWDDVSDPSGVVYELQVATDAGFSNLVIDETELSFSNYVTGDPLEDGVYYWRVRAVDGAGNPSDPSVGWTSPWQFTVDITDPVVTVTSPNGGEFWGGGSDRDITWTADDLAMHASPITIEYSKDGGATWLQIASGEANDGEYSWTVPLLDISTVKVRVTAVDQVGHSGSDESNASFTIDSTPPEVEIDQLPYHPATPVPTPTFTGTATDSASPIDTVEYRVLASDGTTVEVDWTGASFTPDSGDPKTGTYDLTTSALTPGWHLLEVRATDAAGIAWTTSYNEPDGFLVTLKPLVSFDADEPMTVTSPMWITADIRTRDSTPTFTGDALSGVAEIRGVECRIDGGAWADATFTPDPADKKKGTWEFTTKPLSDGWHSIQVRAIDIVEEKSPPELYAEGGAGYFAFTIDTTPPLITNVETSDLTPDSVVITWTTSEPATSQVEYGETEDYGEASDKSTELTTEHRVEITGLKFRTEYHFRVKSADDVGNEAVSGDETFTTPVPVWLYAVVGVGALIILAIVLAVVVWIVRRLLR